MKKNRIIAIIIGVVVSSLTTYAKQEAPPNVDSDTTGRMIEVGSGAVKLRTDEVMLEAGATFFQDSDDRYGAGLKFTGMTFLKFDKLTFDSTKGYGSFFVLNPGIDSEILFSKSDSDEGNDQILYQKFYVGGLALFRAQGILRKRYRSKVKATAGVAVGQIGFQYESDDRSDLLIKSLLVEAVQASAHTAFKVGGILVDVCGFVSPLGFININGASGISGQYGRMFGREDFNNAYRLAASACLGVNFGENVGYLRDDVNYEYMTGGLSPDVVSGLEALRGEGQIVRLKNTLSFREIAGSQFYVGWSIQDSDYKVREKYKDPLTGQEINKIEHKFVKTNMFSVGYEWY